VFVTTGACGKGVWEWTLLSDFHFGPFRATPQAILPLVKDWLQMCDQHHVRCQSASNAAFPSRLIEIVDHKTGSLRLVDGLNCNRKYITLSYRWGDTASSGYVTNSSNVESRHVSFTLHSLPNTIQDAITLTHWLGFQHIWIDAMYEQTSA
jgi:hypothetical protein